MQAVVAVEVAMTLARFALGIGRHDAWRFPILSRSPDETRQMSLRPAFGSTHHEHIQDCIPSRSDMTNAHRRT